MRLLAPAKINLHLRVGKRRADGFHPLLTWMCTVGLFDTLTLEATGATRSAAETPSNLGPPLDPPATERAGELVGFLPDLRFDCDQPGLPRDEGNLVVRIARAFAVEVFAPPPSGGGGCSTGGAAGAKARGESDGGWTGSDRMDGGAVGGVSDGASDRASLDVPGPAGAAQREALGIRDAVRSASVRFVSGGTDGGAGAARDAGRPVGTDGASPSPTDRGHSRVRGPEAPVSPPSEPPLDRVPVAAEVEPGSGGGGEKVQNAPARNGLRDTRLRIALAKRVPVGAGLGGGSSDAARALVGLNRLWNAGWSADQLLGFAARFGSDVPFFVAAAFHGPSAACAGRGEIVRPVPPPAPKWALLALPSFALSTRDVYARFDEMGLGVVNVVAGEPDWQEWAELKATELLPRLVNDLEPAAFSLCPQLARLREDVEQTVGRTVRMSGSGSSLFTLFDAEEGDAARVAAGQVEARFGVAAVAVPLAPALEDDLASVA